MEKFTVNNIILLVKYFTLQCKFTKSKYDCIYKYIFIIKHWKLASSEMCFWGILKKILSCVHTKWILNEDIVVKEILFSVIYNFINYLSFMNVICFCMSNVGKTYDENHFISSHWYRELIFNGEAEYKKRSVIE